MGDCGVASLSSSSETCMSSSEDGGLVTLSEVLAVFERLFVAFFRGSFLSRAFCCLKAVFQRMNIYNSSIEEFTDLVLVLVRF